MTSLPQPTPDGALLIDPDPLLAAIPGLLGFRPQRSVVLMAFDDSRILLATMRQDLLLDDDGRPEPAMRRQLVELGEIVTGYGASGVMATVVDDRCAAAESAGEPVRYGALFRVIERVFASAGGLSAGFVVDEFVNGARWFTAWEPRCRSGRSCPPSPFDGAVAPSGRLSDPLLAPIALQRAVFGGRRILDNRDELAGLLASRTHCDDADCRPVEPFVPPAPPGPRDATRARTVLAAIERGADQSFTCAEVNELAEALSAVHTRDLLLALSLTDLRDDAERMWRRLAASVSGRAGAAAATLLAHLHYMSGEGAFAGIAVDKALELDEDYYLAHLLDTALKHGMRPAGLGEVVAYSFELAEGLGVALPPATRIPAG